MLLNNPDCSGAPSGWASFAIEVKFLLRRFRTQDFFCSKKPVICVKRPSAPNRA